MPRRKRHVVETRGAASPNRRRSINNFIWQEIAGAGTRTGPGETGQAAAGLSTTARLFLLFGDTCLPGQPLGLARAWRIPADLTALWCFRNDWRKLRLFLVDRRHPARAVSPQHLPGRSCTCTHRRAHDLSVDQTIFDQRFPGVWVSSSVTRFLRGNHDEPGLTFMANCLFEHNRTRSAFRRTARRSATPGGGAVSSITAPPVSRLSAASPRSSALSASRRATSAKRQRRTEEQTPPAVGRSCQPAGSTARRLAYAKQQRPVGVASCSVHHGHSARGDDPRRQRNPLWAFGKPRPSPAFSCETRRLPGVKSGSWPSRRSCWPERRAQRGGRYGPVAGPVSATSVTWGRRQGQTPQAAAPMSPGRRRRSARWKPASGIELRRRTPCRRWVLGEQPDAASMREDGRLLVKKGY